MKKLAALMLALSMILILGACGLIKEKNPQLVDDSIEYEKSEGQLVKESHFNPNGLNFLTIEYEYDGFGNIVKETEYGENHALSRSTEYNYDGNGLLIKTTGFTAVDAENLEESYHIDCQYNDGGQLIREDRMSAEGEYESITEYEYDADGKLSIEKIFEGSSTLVAQYEYSYDDAGNDVECVRKDLLEELFITEKCSFDDKGRLTEKTVTDMSGNVIERTEKEYDEYGNEIRCTVYGDDGLIRSETVNEYSFDKWGNTVSCKTSDADGNAANRIEYSWSYAKG